MCSWFTLLLYLNDSGDDIGGGDTTLLPDGDDDDEPRTPTAPTPRMATHRVSPACGLALVFPHGEHPLSVRHSGEPVERGRKYVMRSEILFSEGEEPAAPRRTDV